MRTQGEKKHVMAFKISAVSCKAEWDAHLLQVNGLGVWVFELSNMLSHIALDCPLVLSVGIELVSWSAIHISKVSTTSLTDRG